MEASGLDLFDIDPASIDVFYINQQTGQWKLMPRENIVVNQNEGYVKLVNALLPHFSRYAIGME